MITTEQLFDEPFEPLWMRWQREARRKKIHVRFSNPTVRIPVRSRNVFTFQSRIIKRPRGPIDNRVVWRPKPIIPKTLDAIPCVKERE